MKHVARLNDRTQSARSAQSRQNRGLFLAGSAGFALIVVVVGYASDIPGLEALLRKWAGCFLPGLELALG
ncbi:MAG: hypothetical protein DMF95_28405 [Acidobacteria bacterium]|nr:MAG: hypothetical protein DMF95_28405 [Acidobacteriota bacterium]